VPQSVEAVHAGWHEASKQRPRGPHSLLNWHFGGAVIGLQEPDVQQVPTPQSALLVHVIAEPPPLEPPATEPAEPPVPDLPALPPFE
jgi:hypothetical protein